MGKKQATPDPIIRQNLRGVEYAFETTWGLFSPKEIDPGTKLLVNTIELAEDATVLDIGCGYGPIGIPLAHDCPKGTVHMVDKDFVAIDYAKKNAALNKVKNVEIYLSNGLSHVSKELQFDCIVSNIPAKIGNELLRIFFADIKKSLKPGGVVYVVTISGLKSFIKREFTEVFGNFKKVKQSGTYVISRASKE